MKTNLAIVFLLMLGCTELYASPTDIILKGEIINIPSQKVYLTDAYRWDVFLDSADYNGKSFLFHLDSKKYSPFQASICFKNKTGKIQQLMFVFSSPILVNGSRSTATTSLMLDLGVTNIKGDANVNTSILLPHNAQNQAFEKCQGINFSLRGLNKQNRTEEVNLLVSKIKEYPNSYYLLASLYNYRTSYTKEELLRISSFFDQKIKQSDLAIAFNHYMFTLSCNNCALPNLLVEDDKKTHLNIKYNSGKINMLIFWASWCMPCRKEIPTLKILHKKYASLGLKMFSISIDTDNDVWRKALKIEKMAWPQYIIPQPGIEKTKSEFNFIAIPTVFFVDKSGFELKRFTGFDEKHISEYYNLINSKLGN